MRDDSGGQARCFRGVICCHRVKLFNPAGINHRRHARNLCAETMLEYSAEGEWLPEIFLVLRDFLPPAKSLHQRLLNAPRLCFPLSFMSRLSSSAFSFSVSSEGKNWKIFRVARPRRFADLMPDAECECAKYAERNLFLGFGWETRWFPEV